MSENEEQPKAEQARATADKLEAPPNPQGAELPDATAGSPEAPASPAGAEVPDVLLPLESEQPPSPVQPAPPVQAPPAKKKRGGRFRAILGVSLILFGVLMLGDNLGWFRWFSWSDWWPVILILIGLLMIFRRSRS
jgi:hypothetical protein